MMKASTRKGTTNAETMRVESNILSSFFISIEQSPYERPIWLLKVGENKYMINIITKL